jgi:hypothetical protein
MTLRKARRCFRKGRKLARQVSDSGPPAPTKVVPQDRMGQLATARLTQALTPKKFVSLAGIDLPLRQKKWVRNASHGGGSTG